MSDIQLYRDNSGSLPYLSHWAAKEPAKHRFMAGNTDHWAKMKHKVATFSIRDTTGQVKTFRGDRMRHEQHPDKKSQDKLLKFRHEIDGTLTRIGGPNFSDILVKELHGNLPGDYYKPRPLAPKLLRTAVNARAREGSIYWYMEKPPPKKGRTTFGSDKTFLGLGKRFFP